MTCASLGLEEKAVKDYIKQNKPTYPQFEAWVKKQPGVKLDKATIYKHNAAIMGYIHDEATRKGIHAASGIPDDGSVNWHWTWTFPNPKSPMRTTGSPVHISGLVVANSGEGQTGISHTVAVKVGPRTFVDLWRIGVDGSTDQPGRPCAVHVASGSGGPDHVVASTSSLSSARTRRAGPPSSSRSGCSSAPSTTC